MKRRIILNNPRYVPGVGAWEAGEVASLPQHLAAQLVAQGHAIWLEPEKPAVTPRRPRRRAWRETENPSEETED